MSKPDPVQAFESLAKAADGHWDGVDAVDYVHRLRGKYVDDGTWSRLEEMLARVGPEPDVQPRSR